MKIARSRYATAGIAAVVLGCATQSSVLARSTGAKAADSSNIAMRSYLGSYVAGRMARGMNDTALAVEFYRRALRRAPGNPRIIERSFLMEATEGNWKNATKRARRLIESQPNNRFARLWLGIAAFKARRYRQADKHFERAATGPIGELTATLARAWTNVARSRPKSALRTLKRSRQADWSRHYLTYHRALIGDVTGDAKTARSAFGTLFQRDPRTPRTAVAYIRHAMRSGNIKLANEIFKEHVQASSSGGHAAVLALRPEIDRKVRAAAIVPNANEGLAEVFYGLGEALTNEGGISLGTIYLQMALGLKPDFPFAQAALANVYEATKRFARANAIYNAIRPGTPLAGSIAIRKAVNLNAMDRVDDAKLVLDEMIAKQPKNIRPLEAVGNIMRGRKRYREAIGYYTRILKLLPGSKKQYWTYWYARGTSYERVKDWPNAEKDLLKALALDPEQALTLNYLGYSWVDQKINLERGLKLIEKAVSLKPDDGYIVDSLGWAHYRLGNYKDAVKYLERAVELRPEDPILNDHLGDALWRIGRQVEAKFQWEQALTLKPEQKDAVKIREKLISGLVADDSVKAVKRKKKSVQPQKLGKRADNQTGTRVPVR